MTLPRATISRMRGRLRSEHFSPGQEIYVLRIKWQCHLAARGRDAYIVVTRIISVISKCTSSPSVAARVHAGLQRLNIKFAPLGRGMSVIMRDRCNMQRSGLDVYSYRSLFTFHRKFAFGSSDSNLGFVHRNELVILVRRLIVLLLREISFGELVIAASYDCHTLHDRKLRTDRIHAQLRSFRRTLWLQDDKPFALSFRIDNCGKS